MTSDPSGDYYKDPRQRGHRAHSNRNEVWNVIQAHGGFGGPTLTRTLTILGSAAPSYPPLTHHGIYFPRSLGVFCGFCLILNPASSQVLRPIQNPQGKR